MCSRSAFVLLLVLAACGGKKFDRGEVDAIVKSADRCAKTNDLMCVLQDENRIAKLAGLAPDLGADDQAYFNAALKQVDADVKTVENTPPGRPPAAK
jgi:hypothetical protein